MALPTKLAVPTRHRDRQALPAQPQTRPIAQNDPPSPAPQGVATVATERLRARPGTSTAKRPARFPRCWSVEASFSWFAGWCDLKRSDCAVSDSVTDERLPLSATCRSCRQQRTPSRCFRVAPSGDARLEASVARSGSVEDAHRPEHGRPIPRGERTDLPAWHHALPRSASVACCARTRRAGRPSAVTDVRRSHVTTRQNHAARPTATCPERHRCRDVVWLSMSPATDAATVQTRRRWRVAGDFSSRFSRSGAPFWAGTRSDERSLPGVANPAFGDT